MLLSHFKMKLLGGFLNFHVRNQKPHIFMLDFMKQSLGLGVDTCLIFLVWICLDLVYQLNWLTIWHKKTICFGFSFSWFFSILMPIWILSNPRFDQDNLNKLKTWIWKGEHVSFLVTLKCSFREVFEISMFETQNHISSCLT